jgi:NAD(P)-dependent dehydrogenase (short-subunit alcohol dehydrogenase family)
MTTSPGERIALVTGANDPEGLGFGIAACLLAEGATVYFGCRLESQARALAEPLGRLTGHGTTAAERPPGTTASGVHGGDAAAPTSRRPGGPRADGLPGAARPIRIDVADPASIRDAFARIVSEAGGLDMLVNNAGDGANCGVLDETAEQWDRILATNARGPFLCSQAAARLMLPRGAGRIVNISSQAAAVAIRDHVAYSCSKAALNMLTKSMALELAPFGITVNAVAPTYLETPGTRPSLARAEFRQSVLDRIPVGRLGSIHDVAHAVRFLCHPDSGLITGAVLPVDGGWTLA